MTTSGWTRHIEKSVRCYLIWDGDVVERVGAPDRGLSAGGL
jgi:hypothetical protein